MRIKKILQTSFISCCISLLVGCASDTCVTIPSTGNSNNTNIGSGMFGSTTITPSSEKLAGNLLFAKVALYNKTTDNQKLKYQFQWFSPDGFNQGNPTPWTPIELLPNMTKVVSSIAPTAETTNYNVLVCAN
ncbi:MAG: YcfL family protein [Gammaproteobacteria bacterium]|jgi:uncharacterized protein YcfL|nr:YcfL family protein [Gammaproteobacteria bacterium]